MSNWQIDSIITTNLHSNKSPTPVKIIKAIFSDSDFVSSLFRMEQGDFLTFGEAELLVEGLKPTKLEAIGSKG